MQPNNTTGTMDIGQLLIILTPLSFSLLASLLLNFVLVLLLGKMALRYKPEMAATQSILKTTPTPEKDCEVFQNEHPVYSTVRAERMTPLDTLSFPLSPNTSPDVVYLESNPMYQSADPLAPPDPSYYEIN